MLSLDSGYQAVCRLGSQKFQWLGVLYLFQAYLLGNLGLDTGLVVLSLFHASCSQLPPEFFYQNISFLRS